MPEDEKLSNLGRVEMLSICANRWLPRAEQKMEPSEKLETGYPEERVTVSENINESWVGSDE